MALKFEISQADRILIERQLNALGNVDRNKAVKYGLNQGIELMRSQGLRALKSSLTKREGNLFRAITKSILPVQAIGYTYSSKKKKGAHLILTQTEKKTRRFTKKGAYRGINFKGKKTKYYTPSGRPGAWVQTYYRLKTKIEKLIVEGLYKAIDNITKTRKY